MAGYIRAAAEDVLSGKAAAIVTCPVTKEGLKTAGVPFPGHTEFLAHLCGGADVAMMLAGDRLRVALVTIHVGLRRALELLSPALIERTVRITHAFFRRYMGTSSPRIAVAALNPHAGEGGMFGDEETTLIAPAISACRAAGIDASGPYPPDTVFYRAYRGGFDVVVAMTHDHGLIPLKLVHFDDGVNVTMGLPIVRTSVDHGTAYDIAGKGKADACADCHESGALKTVHADTCTTCHGNATYPALPAGKYAWYVRAKNAAGTGPWSPYRSFAVGLSSPTPTPPSASTRTCCGSILGRSSRRATTSSRHSTRPCGRAAHLFISHLGLRWISRCRHISG